MESLTTFQQQERESALLSCTTAHILVFCTPISVVGRCEVRFSMSEASCGRWGCNVLRPTTAFHVFISLLGSLLVCPTVGSSASSCHGHDGGSGLHRHCAPWMSGVACLDAQVSRFTSRCVVFAQRRARSVTCSRGRSRNFAGIG